MNFIEKNRNTEPHDESILYLYLQDANGAPVANRKIKIYAGPPPSGEPPYFVDDDPDSPSRRTDGDGKFQFIIANGAPTNRLDFFTVVLGSDDTPQSKPIHFAFPTGQAQWVTVILGDETAPENVGGSGDTPLNATTTSEAVFGAPPPMSLPEQIPMPAYLTAAEPPAEPAPAAVTEPLPTAAQPAPVPTQPQAEIQSPPNAQSQTATPPQPEAPPPVQPQPRPSPQPTGSVRGRIRNATAGARLVLKTPGRTLDALVASDGLYSFTNVPVGTFTLELGGVGVINPALVVTANQTVTFDYPPPQQAPTKKVLRHYLLFGPGTQPGTMTNLILALDYIVHFVPIVGFSVDEAMSAERVTIVGSTAAVSSQDELRLRDGGCQVARLQAPDSYALENLFQQLLASGSPYP